MKRPLRSSIIARAECLESRTLRAGGLASGLDVVKDLGSLSPSAAIAGVEVTAMIPAKGSVTFEFSAEKAGEYTLLVRYEGGGLGLGLMGPGEASAVIRPGPAGPFSMVNLSVEATTYRIKAAALGDGPVFVDWELFLNSGVGQSATAGISAGPGGSVAIPLPSLTSAGQGPSGLAPGSSGVSLASSSSTSAVVGGPIGRPAEVAVLAPVGPSSGPNSSVLAFAGHVLPEGLVLDRAIDAGPDLFPGGPARPIPTLELLADAEGSKRDAAALDEMTWWEHLVFDRAPAVAADATLGEAEPGQAAAVASVPAEGPEPPAAALAAEPGRTEQAGFGLELVAAAGIVASLARRSRRKKRALPAWQRFEDSDQAHLPLSMI